MIDALERAHASARPVWKLTAPNDVRIDVDATLLTAHSDKEGAAGNLKGGHGFHLMLAYCDDDETLWNRAATTGRVTAARLVGLVPRSLTAPRVLAFAR